MCPSSPADDTPLIATKKDNPAARRRAKDRSAAKTKYGRLASSVERDIRDGRLRPGEAVPSIRRLMASSNLSKATVIKGLSLLEESGLVRCHPQRGYFVSERGGPKAVEGKQIAFVTPALCGDAAPYAKGISSALDPEQHTLATFSTHGDLDTYQRLVGRVMDLRPAGLVLATVRPSLLGFDPRPLIEAGIPTVLLGHSVAGLSCDRVSEGKAAAAKSLVRYLIKQDYADAAVIACGRGELTPEDSLAWALKTELTQNGFDLGPDRLFTLPGLRGYGSHPDPYSEAEELVSRELAQGRRYRVIVADHDYPAIGAMRAVVAAGLKIPEDVAVISGLKCAVSVSGLPTLTTFDHHRDLEGRTAAELLLRRLGGDDRPPEVHYLSSTLSVGESA